MHFVMFVANTDKKSLADIMHPFDENCEDVGVADKEIFCKKGEYKNYFEKKLKPFYQDNTVDAELKESCPDLIVHSETMLNKYEQIKDNENALAEFILSIEGGYMDAEGNLYYMCNNNAKWDWYSVGGRWENWLRTNDNKDCNLAKRKDINLDLMLKRELENYANKYDSTKEAHPKDYWLHLDPFVDYVKNITKQEYLSTVNIIVMPYGFLYDGEWVDEDDYSELVYTEKFYKWWDNLDPETEITVVDCHI